MKQNKLDELFRKKLKQRNFEFKEDAWAAMEEKLNTGSAGGGLWSKGLTYLLILIAVSAGIWMFWPTLSINTNDSTKLKQPLELAAKEKYIQADDKYQSSKNLKLANESGSKEVNAIEPEESAINGNEADFNGFRVDVQSESITRNFEDYKVEAEKSKTEISDSVDSNPGIEEILKNENSNHVHSHNQIPNSGLSKNEGKANGNNASSKGFESKEKHELPGFPLASRQKEQSDKNDMIGEVNNPVAKNEPDYKSMNEGVDLNNVTGNEVADLQNQNIGAIEKESSEYVSSAITTTSRNNVLEPLSILKPPMSRNFSMFKIPVTPVSKVPSLLNPLSKMPKLWRFNVSTFIGANSISKSLKTNSTDADGAVNYRLSHEYKVWKPEFGLGLGVSRGRLSFNSGVSFSEYGEEIKYENTFTDSINITEQIEIQYIDTSYWEIILDSNVIGMDSIWVTMILDSLEIVTYDTTIESTSNELDNRNGITSIKYTEIPFVFGYKFQVGSKWMLEPHLGMSIGFLQASRGYYLSKEGDELIKLGTQETILKKTLFNTLYGLRVGYKLSSSLMLEVEGGQKRNLNSIFEEKDYLQKFKSNYARLRLRYYF